MLEIIIRVFLGLGYLAIVCAIASVVVGGVAVLTIYGYGTYVAAFSVAVLICMLAYLIGLSF